jgi:hypothetical protein
MWSTPDLSNVTLVLQDLLNNAVQAAGIAGLAVGKIAPTSCDSPEIFRTNNSTGQCVLTLYLLHVGRDPYWRNTPVSGPRPQLNNAQPLSLNLSYLLTAYCDKDFQTEQLAMSIALQAIHCNPIMSATTAPFPAGDNTWSDLPNGEFVISIEADTIEEMSRLWQAFTVPIRLSALIKASVVFVSPLVLTSPPYPPPSTANLAVGPFALQPTPPAMAPTLTAGYGQQNPPVLPGTTLAQLAPGIGPLVAVGGVPAPQPGTTAPLFGSYVVIAGNALDLADAASVYLGVPGSAMLWDVTAWRQGITPGELILALPDVYAAPTGSPLTATPPPGIYNVGVGSGGVLSSNPVPLAIAPRVDGVANPPLLSANAAKVFTVSGAGFMPATAVTLALGTVALAFSPAAVPAAGGFSVNATGTTIVFIAPTTLAAGSYPLLLAVNGVAAGIGWLAVVT